MAVIRWIKEISDRFTMQKACDKAVPTTPEVSFYIPGRFKTQEMCNKAVRREPYTLRLVSDHLKTGNV